jgi:NAD(P)-dependent dehydrogenase (short-subunit alcohol dehydrogenase family)
LTLTIQSRRKVLITGAAGGMGRACARLFGATQDLVLTDVVTASLDQFAEELRSDGYAVTTQAGDLTAEQLLASLAQATEGDAPFTLVHAAGLSPSLADWRTIMQVNLVASEKLLRALEPGLTRGSVAVLIASMAGHMLPPLPEVEAMLADPLQPDFMEKIGGVIESFGGENSPGGRSGLSYTLSKRAVVNMCERRAAAWGQKGARIVSISPGMILTPMGRSEMEKTPGAIQTRDAAAIGRIGTPMDIALAAHFLASDAASFITGSDLKVDGGAIAGLRNPSQ